MKTFANIQKSVISHLKSSARPAQGVLYNIGLVALFLLIGTGNVWGTDYTWTCTSGTFSTSGAALSGASSSNIIWTASLTGTSQGTGVSGEKCVQIAKNNGLTLQTSSISGTISSITLQTWGSQGNNLTCAVGSFSETKSIPTSYSSSGSTVTFSPNASGTITFTWASATKAFNVRKINITYSTGATATLTLKLPKGDGTFVDYETTDKSELADYDLMVSEKACYGSAAFWGGSWNSGYWTDAFIDYDDATTTQPTRYNKNSTFSTDKTLWPLFVYGSTPTYYHTDPYCPTYHVTYDGNGKTSGTVPSDATDYDGGETVTVKSATLTKTNYTFTGWNTESDGSGTHYAASGSATFTITEDVTLYAEWCRDLSTLTSSEFDLEASSITGTSARIDWIAADATKYNVRIADNSSWASATYKYSADNVTSTDVTRTDLTPATKYWVSIQAKNDCGETSKVKTITFTTLAAYVVTYYKNDGSATSATESKTEGVNYTISSNKFSRDGYTLSKWNTQAGGGGTDYAKGATYSADAPLDLYAVWTANNYTITLDKNGGSGGLASVSATYGSAAPSVGTPPTKADKNFAGYWTGEGGTGTMVVDASGVWVANISGYTDGSKNWIGTEGKTIYAKWVDKTYTNYRTTCEAPKTLDYITIDTDPTKLIYLVGETVNTAGAVVTAHYTDDTSSDVTASVTWTAPSGALSAGLDQALTASYTLGGVTKTATHNVIDVYAVTLLKKDETGATISGELSDAPAVSLTSVNHLTAAETGNQYTFWKWEVSNGSLSSTSSLTPTIDAVSGAITVTAIYYKPITVTWSVNGSVYSGPSIHSHGWNTIYPSDPTPASVGCEGKVFIGWSRTPDYRSDDTAPTDMVESGEALTKDEHFYAVFADKESEGTAPEWTKTALGSVTAGTYLICTTNGKPFNGTMSSGHGQPAGSAFSSANWALNVFNEDAPIGAQEITFSTNGSGWKMYVEGSGYLYATKASSGGFSYQADAGEEYWYESSSAWRYSKNYSGNYAYLRVYSSTFRTYNSSTGGDAGIVLLKKTAAGSPAVYSDYTTSCTCKGFSFHTGSGTDDAVKTTNTRTCFEQVDASTTWKIDDYVIPSDAKFFVGWQDEFKSSGLGSSSRSAVTQFNADEALYFEYTKNYGAGYRPSVGNAVGAIGTLRIWSDNDWNNCHVGFDPNGYIFKLGSTYYTMSNSATLDGARYKETEVITLTSSDISGQFQVNIAAVAPNASTGVASRYTENKNLVGMGVKSGADSWRGEGIKASDANTKGFFRIDKGEGGATNWNAHWVPCYELTFDLKGGSGSIVTTPEYVSVEAASKVVQIPTTAPTRSGYRFMGWSDDDNNTVEYAAGSTHNVTLSGNKTVYAVWAQEYTVTYDANGGTTSCSEPAHIAGETVTVCATEPTRDCSTFLGWLGDNGIGTKAASATFTMPAANVTLTAQWNTTQYAITYKDQSDVTYTGSNIGSLPANHTCGSATVLPNGVKEGYRFDGWFTTSACTGDPITSLASDAVGPFTLYAKWTAAYTFTFSKNGVVDGTLTLGQVEGGNVILPNTTVDCGLWTTFEGWVIGDVAETTTEPATIYKPGDIFVAGNSDQEFKAVYSKHEGDASVYYEKVTSGPKSGEYVLVSSPVTAASNKTYIYKSQSSGTSSTDQATIEEISFDGSGHVTALPSGVKVLTVYVGRGGTYANKIAIKHPDYNYLVSTSGNYLLSNEETQTDAYIWELMDGSTKVNDKDRVPAAGALHSTAHVTRLMQVRNVSTPDRIVCYENTQGNDVFLYRKRVAGTTYYTTAPGSCDVPTEITVSYNDNKAYAGDQTISGMPSGTTLTFTEYPNFASYTIGSAPTDPTGYHFTGWNTSVDGGGDAYTAGSSVTTFGYTETITLYAQWERVYTVTLMDNGVERRRMTQESAGANVTLPSGNNCTPSSAFTFVGWTDSPVQLNAEPVRPNIVSGAGEWGDDELTDDITLYSVYSKSVTGCDDFAAGVSGAYKMYYNGSTYATTAGSTGSYTGATSGTAEVFYIAYAPAHTGYTIRTSTGFVGWNHDGSELTKANATPYYWKISGSSSNWVITPEPSAYTKQLKSTDGNKFQLYAAATSGKLLLQTSAMTYYYNTAICEGAQITFHDGGGAISGTPTTPDGASWNSGTHVLSGLEDCDKITTFPTANYDGWTFIGWSTEDYSNSGKHTTDHPEENAGTDEPDGSEIYKTGGNPYVVRGGSVDLYPVFTRFPDNEPFNTESGGDYYIYYLKPGTDDGYGANIRVYAGEYDGEKRYGQTTSCAAATEFTFTKDGDIWHIYDKTTSKYVAGLSSEDWLLHANDLSGTLDDWTLTIKSGNQFYASCQEGGRYITFSTSADYFMDYSTTANPGICLPVYLGSCTERIFSSEPNPTPTIDLTGEPMVTSSKGQTVRAAIPMTLSASHITGTSPLKVTITGTNLKFATSAAVNTDPAASLEVAVDGSGKIDPTTIYVYYTPTEDEDGIENIIVTAVATRWGPTEIKRTTGIVHARHLPEDFVIATKLGDKWYALPANCTTNSSSTEGMLIEVDDVNDPTAATAAPASTKYGLRNVAPKTRKAGHGERMVFTERISTATADNQKTLYNGSSTNIQVNAMYTTYKDNDTEATREKYEWTPETSDFKDYLLTSASASRTLSMNTSGVFGSLTQDKAYSGQVRLLPATFYTPADMQVVEWKANKVVVMYTGSGVTATTKVGTNSESSAQTLTTAKVDHGVFELTTDQALTSNTNTQLLITIKNGSSAVVGKKALVIPAIINTDNKTADYVVSGADAAERIAKAATTDVVILDGAVLSAVATKYTYKNITVYPGGKLVIGSGKQLGMASLTLRGGSSWGAASYEYKYPQFIVNNATDGAYSNTAVKINYDYVTTKAQYYTFVLPYTGNTSTIKYPVDIYGKNLDSGSQASFEFQYYDGEARAAGGTGWATLAEPADLVAGRGYTFLGMPRKVDAYDGTDNSHSNTRQTYGIHRIPMSVAANAVQSGETTDKNITIAVTLATKNNDSGWNLIGNPYMSDVSGLSNTDIQVGQLVHTSTVPWDGKWQWDDTNPTTGVRYIVTTDDGQTFESQQASTATLTAFKNFFVQIQNEEANTLVIPANSRADKLLAPARYKEEAEKDIMLAVDLVSEAHKDKVDLLINDIYTAEFDQDGDFTKMMNGTKLNIYGVYPGDNLSFIAVDKTTAAGSIAIGYQVPAGGDYTLQLSDRAYVMADAIEALYVTDHEVSPEVTTDLLDGAYTFHVNNAETNDTRFTISIKLKEQKEDITTGVNAVDAVSEKPVKFIYQDKIYILIKGVIYDATGKKVSEINK